MPLKKIIRRRLLSLLQPWLLEEPEFDLKLGFVQSFAVAENLRLDVSVLDQLFDSPALLFFKDVTVERLSIRFSNWYAPAFSIEVHGVHVILSFEKPEGEGYMRRLKTSKHDYTENVRKKLSVLDPEGCTLHHLLERILFAVPSRKDFSTSFVNLILKHCHLEVRHFHVDVQFPILNDVFMCVVELEEFNARSKYLDDRCLTRGLLSAVFLPLNENSYILNGIGLKVGFNEKDCTDRVLLSSDLCTFIKLSDLQLADCSLCFPELVFSFSPDDISIYLAFDRLLSNKYNHARSARELWKLAARRIGDVIVTPRLSLHRLVSIIGQWVHYVNAYESLLLLMGYSSGLLVNSSISKISWKKPIFVSARHHWKVISDTEKQLPVEGIALARRVARHRASLKVQSDSDTCLITNPSNFFRPFLSILVLIWKVFSKIIHSLANYLFLRKEMEQDPYTDGGLGSLTRNSCQSCCFILNFGKLVITVSPTNKIQPSEFDKLQSHTGIAYADFHSISFCFDALLYVSVEDIFEQRVFLSCGQMKVIPTSFKASSEMNMLSSSEKENMKERLSDMESILWVEPAKLSFTSDANDSQVEGSCAFHLENFLEKICLSWKGICNSFNESEVEYSENPSLLCKVERSLTYPGLKNPDSGFPECCLILGKLNLVLVPSSVLSVSLLLSQIRHYIWWEDKGKTSMGANCMDKPEICWVNKIEYYVKEWITTLLEMLPEKHIHLGIFVDGPSVKILQNKKPILVGQEVNDIVSQDGFDLTFDFHEIEVAIGSPSLFGMETLVDLLGFDDAEAESVRLEPQAIDIPKPNNDKYASWGKISFGFHLRLNGLDAYLRKSTKNHQFQLFVLKPIVVHISSFR